MCSCLFFIYSCHLRIAFIIIIIIIIHDHLSIRACEKYPKILLLVESVRESVSMTSEETSIDDELNLTKYLNAMEQQYSHCKRNIEERSSQSSFSTLQTDTTSSSVHNTTALVHHERDIVSEPEPQSQAVLPIDGSQPQVPTQIDIVPPLTPTIMTTTTINTTVIDQQSMQSIHHIQSNDIKLQEESPRPFPLLQQESEPELEPDLEPDLLTTGSREVNNSEDLSTTDTTNNNNKEDDDVKVEMSESGDERVVTKGSEAADVNDVISPDQQTSYDHDQQEHYDRLLYTLSPSPSLLTENSSSKLLHSSSTSGGHNSVLTNTLSLSLMSPHHGVSMDASDPDHPVATSTSTSTATINESTTTDILSMSGNMDSSQL